ncbi:hypothetical protein [Streptomyces sp. bgisy031]|uniref:hypothetical protein n=1 Tax=Streptomyces sp. bgisy031 TaxID=3413772 RepID=UPI003D70DFBF
MSFPAQPRPHHVGGAPPDLGRPTPPRAARRDESAAALLAGRRRLLRRFAPLPAVGFTAYAVAVAAVPGGLRARIAGPFTVSLLLMGLQVVAVVAALVGHGREARRHDLAVARFRRHAAVSGIRSQA